MLHRSWSPTFTPNIGSDEHDAWERGYKAVNESFATTVVELAGDEEIALLCRDYQLMLVSGYVRKQRPTAIIHQSFETPWPWPSDFEILPSNWRYELLHSLLLADVISFSSNQDIDAFIACAKSTLGDEIRVEDSKSQHLSFGDHQIQLTVSPPPVRSSRFKLVAEFEATQRAISQLNEWSGQHTFVTVDRAEPHKNIVRSINAFGELLKKQPELTNDVRFLLYLTPGPAHISAYKRLLEEIRRSARRVNDRSNGVNPVHIREDGNFSRAVAALATYDTLVSVPLVDGTGRSILDGPLVNTKQGGMILSETTAAAELLADQVSLVGFSDVAAMASAMSDAVAEDSSSRKNKSDDTRRTIENLVGATDSGQPIYEIIERLIETVD